MRYFHVNQAGSYFQQSSLNLMDFLPYVRHRTYEHDRQHVAECEGIPQYLQSYGDITWPTTCLWRGAHPTTWNSSSALLQIWNGAPHLPSIAFMTLRNPPSPHSSLQFRRRSQHIRLWRANLHGWFEVLCAPHAAKIPNYSTVPHPKRSSQYVMCQKLQTWWWYAFETIYDFVCIIWNYTHKEIIKLCNYSFAVFANYRTRGVAFEENWQAS
jgi:hypothetical protein